MLGPEAEQLLLGDRQQVHPRRAEKGGDEGVGRPVVDRLRRPDLLHQSPFHHHDAVAQAHRLDLVMGDEDRGDAELALKELQLVAGIGAQLGVQVAQRLVEQQDLRLGHDRAGDRHPLPFAAGKLARAAVEQMIDAHLARRLPNPLLPLRPVPGAPLRLQRKGDVVGHGHVRIERVGLEDHGDAALARRQRRDVARSDAHAPFRGLLQAGHRAHQGGLAAPGRPEHDQELARFDLQIDAGDRYDVAEALHDPGNAHRAHVRASAPRTAAPRMLPADRWSGVRRAAARIARPFAPLPRRPTRRRAGNRGRASRRRSPPRGHARPPPIARRSARPWRPWRPC